MKAKLRGREVAKLRLCDDSVLKCPFIGVICHIYYHRQYVIIFIVKLIMNFIIYIFTSPGIIQPNLSLCRFSF